MFVFVIYGEITICMNKYEYIYKYKMLLYWYTTCGILQYEKKEWRFACHYNHSAP